MASHPPLYIARVVMLAVIDSLYLPISSMLWCVHKQMTHVCCWQPCDGHCRHTGENLHTHTSSAAGDGTVACLQESCCNQKERWIVEYACTQRTQVLMPKEWVAPFARKLLGYYTANTQDALMLTRWCEFLSTEQVRTSEPLSACFVCMPHMYASKQKNTHKYTYMHICTKKLHTCIRPYTCAQPKYNHTHLRACAREFTCPQTHTYKDNIVTHNLLIITCACVRSQAGLVQKSHRTRSRFPISIFLCGRLRLPQEVVTLFSTAVHLQSPLF